MTTAAARPLGLARAIRAIPFILVHLAVFAAIFTGVDATSLVLCGVLFAARMFGVTGGYHRYFSHRTYKTSRLFQFILAFLAQSSGQKGALWWAAHHRTHHVKSDQEGDIHSPRLKGFLYAHVGWLFDETDETNYRRVRDLARYPELVWLNENWFVAPLTLGIVVFAIFGLPGLVVGFCWSTVLLWHSTFTINSLAHVFGRRRFETSDDSRNNVWLALLTFGEGWHNNHHHYESAARNGFYWWEIDVTYYVLRALAFFGIVWDLREVPDEVLADGRARDRAS